MKPETKKKVIVGLSLAALTGIILYAFRKQIFGSKEEPKAETKEEPAKETTTTTAQTQTSSAGIDDVSKFQAFANSKGWTPKLKVDGVHGPKTESAWQKYGAEYTKSNTPAPTLKQGDKLWAARNAVALYRLPDTSSANIVGSVQKDANHFAFFVQNANAKGWMKVSAVYKNTKGQKVQGIVYVPSTSVTNIAP